MPQYQCLSPSASLLPLETIEAESGFLARKAYAAKHKLPTVIDVICRRVDMIDDQWRKLASTRCPAGWDSVEV